MSVTGICLILFVTFHALMNGVALFWPAAYNEICLFLGANWYALIASAGLAALFLIHIIYALWLTVQNRKARGSERYDVNARQPQVEWSSKNMLVLGIVVLAFLGIHLIQFWAKMQLAEICGHEYQMADGAVVPPAAGTLFLHIAFSQPWTLVVSPYSRFLVDASDRRLEQRHLDETLEMYRQHMDNNRYRPLRSPGNRVHRAGSPWRLHRLPRADRAV